MKRRLGCLFPKNSRPNDSTSTHEISIPFSRNRSCSKPSEASIRPTGSAAYALKAEGR